jgi:hypothetical protein
VIRFQQRFRQPLCRSEIHLFPFSSGDHWEILTTPLGGSPHQSGEPGLWKYPQTREKAHSLIRLGLAI